MKHTITIFALTMCAFAATAKKTIPVPENTIAAPQTMHKPFVHTGFELGNTTITFSKLPKHTTGMYIVDANGHIASSGTVSRKNNTVNVKELMPGIYTIVLQQGNTVQMFGYSTDIVVSAPCGIAS